MNGFGEALNLLQNHNLFLLGQHATIHLQHLTGNIP